MWIKSYNHEISVRPYMNKIMIQKILKNGICTVCIHLCSGDGDNKESLWRPLHACRGRSGVDVHGTSRAILVRIPCLSGNDGIHGIYPRTEGSSTCGRSLGNQKVVWTALQARVLHMLHFFHGSKGEKPTKLKVSWHLLAWDVSDVLRSWTGLKHEAFQDARGWRRPRRPRLCRVMDTELTCLPRTSSKRWMATLMHWCTTKHLKPALCKHWISCDSSQHSKYVEFR